MNTIRIDFFPAEYGSQPRRFIYFFFFFQDLLDQNLNSHSSVAKSPWYWVALSRPGNNVKKFPDWSAARALHMWSSWLDARLIGSSVCQKAYKERQHMSFAATLQFHGTEKVFDAIARQSDKAKGSPINCVGQQRTNDVQTARKNVPEPGCHHTTAGRGPIASRREPGRHHTTTERKATAVDRQPKQNTEEAPLDVCRTPVRPARNHDVQPPCHPWTTWDVQQQRKWRHRQQQRQWRPLESRHPDEEDPCY